MKQTRRHSIIETLTDVFVGFVGSWLLSYYVLPFWGFVPSVQSATEVTVIYTLWAFLRKYAVRRAFNERC